MTIFVQITGRLGNNLFQIALGYALSQKTNQNFVMVYNSYNRYEQEYISYFPEITFIPREMLPNTVMYSEKRDGINCFEFHPEVFQLCKTGNIFFDGYFQNHKYFMDYLPELKKLFLKNEIKEINGYFIHVRRGDFVNHPVYQIDYQQYFKKAIQHFPKDSKFYVVSDDIPFCENYNLLKDPFGNGKFDVSFVDLDTLGTLHFMASCKGGICANSSFSWWGALLGKREIVTMPSQWINNGMDTSDIYFDNVIVI
jgi:hypothetical protein